MKCDLGRYNQVRAVRIANAGHIPYRTCEQTSRIGSHAVLTGSPHHRTVQYCSSFAAGIWHSCIDPTRYVKPLNIEPEASIFQSKRGVKRGA